MLTLRLQRVGRKHDPSYRIVATNSRTGPKSNKHVELLGHFDAIRKTFSVDEESVKKHLANGATISDTLKNIFITNGVLDGKKVNVLPKKSPVVDEEALAKEAEEKAAAEAATAEEATEKESTEETTEDTSAEEAQTEDAPAEEPVAEEEEAPAEEPADEETPAEGEEDKVND